MTVDDARLVVAQGSRILYAQGVVDAFGHLSCRHPRHSDRFLMSRSMAPGLVTPGDVLELDLDGNPVSDPGARVFLERFIHAEIYRVRPDVSAVAHSHSAAVVPFTAVAERVRPIAHTCGFLCGTGPAFDVAELAGDGSDLLIRDGRLGRAFARHLGQAAVGLMRSHGFTAVGGSVQETVYRAVYTARNCELQMAALQLGEPRYLTPAESLACEATNRTQVGRPWELWAEQIEF